MPVHINGQPSSAVNKRVLLTTDDVAAWEGEAKSLRERIQALESEVAAIEAKLAAAAFFMRDGGASETPAPQIVRPRINLLRPMTAFVRDLFAEGVRMSAGDVVTTLSDHPEVGNRVRLNANNVYTALARLAERKILMRDESGVYSLYEAIEPPSGVSAGGSGAREGSNPSLNLQPPAHPDG
jgi:hypothetical protein